MRIYIVQKGDTLQHIAAEHNVGIDTLMQLNSHISSEAYVVPGMKIKIPKSSLEWKQKKETNRAKDEEAVPFSNVKRPLGEVGQFEPKNNEEEYTDDSQNNQNAEQITAERSFAETKQFKVEHKLNEEARNFKAEYENNEPKRPNFDYNQSINRHPYYEYDRPIDRSLNNRKQPMHPTYYHPPYNHYCPICAYHWQMHMAHYSPFDPRHRRK